MANETIPAGRETDARVALEVLGWTKHRNDRPATEVDAAKVDWEYAWVPGEFRGDPNYQRRLPAYSTEDAAAMFVVEALRRRGWLVVLKAMPDGLPFLAGAGWGPGEGREIPVRYIAEGQWTRRPECGEPLRGLVARQVGMADALALAVCRLALKCVAAEREAER